MEIEREGETLFALNSNGTNEWMALVQRGERDDGSRLTSSDAAKIAAEIQSMPKRIAELEAQLNLHQERIDWLLSHCTVNRWDDLSLPSGSSEISGQDKLESICRIDKAIFRSKNNARSPEGKE